MLINKEVDFFFYNLGVGCVWGVIAPVPSVSQWGTLDAPSLGPCLSLYKYCPPTPQAEASSLHLSCFHLSGWARKYIRISSA